MMTLHETLIAMHAASQKEPRYNFLLRLSDFAGKGVVVKVIDIGPDFIYGVNADKEEEFYPLWSIQRVRDVSNSEAHKKHFQ